MASYPVEVQDRLTDLRQGIPSKCQFLPTIAAIVEMADGFAKQDMADAAFKERFSRRAVAYSPPQRQFQPFPRLWEAFANEPDILKSKTFEAYDDAARALATQGREAARIVINSKSRKDAA
jgi:hypothetical protein